MSLLQAQVFRLGYIDDEKEQLAVIVECKVNERIPRSTLNRFKEYFRHSNAQFGLLAVGTDLAKSTFFQILEGEIAEITRSQFEKGLIEFGSS